MVEIESANKALQASIDDAQSKCDQITDLRASIDTQLDQACSILDDVLTQIRKNTTDEDRYEGIFDSASEDKFEASLKFNKTKVLDIIDEQKKRCDANLDSV